MSCPAMPCAAMPPEGPHHLHLDPLGGVAGDMMVAALWPLAPTFRAAHSLASLGVPPSLEVTLEPASDAGFAGARLAIRGAAPPPPRGALALLAFVAEAPLPDRVRARVTDMLQRLAAAEAAVHGMPMSEVHFHELASWDTLIDLTLSAALIEALRIETVSIGPLPLGGGTVKSAHGALPLPAPATLRLLEGLRFVDDGIGGERVTPTGAAILAHLAPSANLPGTPALVRSAAGFGTRRLPDRANQLRALLFEATGNTRPGDEIARIRFEIDDQSGEDLATGLDAVRAVEGVVDVVAWPVFGKKGRIATAVQVLTRPAALAAAIEACFTQTTTIGLRHDRVARTVLERRSIEVEALPVKEVRRPNGRLTRKLEADAVADQAGDAAERAALRRRVETAEPG
jgi:pyridinium-3,5-bisthiocarboxylic acid mononucleotide nickel chelatase